MNNENSVRDATKTRYRAALIMSTPFCLKLKSMGIYTAKDLMNVNLDELGMPNALRGQLEALLSVVTLTSAKAKPAFSYHNYESTNNDIFTVPLLYDSRFQLGPLDPLGRPPRLGKLEDVLNSPIKKHQNRNKKSRVSFADDEEAGDDSGVQLAGDGGSLNLPGGIWNNDGIYKTEESVNSVPLPNANLFTFKAKESVSVSSKASVKSNPDWDKYQAKIRSKSTKYGYSSNTSVLNSSGTQRMSASTNDLAQGVPPPSTVQFTKSIDNVSSILNTNESVIDVPLSANNKKKNSSQNKRPGSNATLYTTDFQAYVKNGFERPYVCSKCNQAFSRAYTLKVHEKSHETFSNYHLFKSKPQLFLDDDKETLVMENMRKYIHDISLPPVIQQDLKLLLIQNQK